MQAQSAPTLKRADKASTQAYATHNTGAALQAVDSEFAGW
jgi:hypothetical protein